MKTVDTLDKPIAAIATPLGYGGISVVRISGQGSFAVADRLLGTKAGKIAKTEHGTFFHTQIYDCVSGERLDDALILVFRAPGSYTGEDTVEIQGHGGLVPAERLLNAVLRAGARLAEPGEFTKRAFLNGRLDLTQAEAVCDLIQSQTERAAAVAKARLDGALGNRVEALYDDTLDVSSGLEHVLDFDEGEIADEFVRACVQRIDSLQSALQALIATWREGELLRQGVLVVLCGAPNAGKSSLLNALLQRNRAIVHSTPGTTRDVIEESYSLNGVPVRLVDTAGLRDSPNAIECEGIRRAHALIDQADMNLLVVDRSRMSQRTVDSMLDLFDPAKLIVVLNKTDISKGRAPAIPRTVPTVSVSAINGDGLDALKKVMTEQLGIKDDFQTQPVVNQRHLEELILAESACGSALTTLENEQNDIVIAAGYLREGAEALGRITGKIYAEDLLDNIFRNFCVGK